MNDGNTYSRNVGDTFRHYCALSPDRLKRESTPTVDAAQKAFQRAQEAYATAKDQAREILRKAEQRATQDQEKARRDQQEAQAKVDALEAELEAHMAQGGDDAQGVALESKRSFFVRKAEHAAKAATATATLTPEELAQLQAVVHQEAEASRALEVAVRDLRDALGNELDRLFQMWPENKGGRYNEFLPASKLLGNTFPQVNANTPGEYVAHLLNR